MGEKISRKDNRSLGELRKISIVPAVNPYAEGSVEVSFGNTKLLCTATVEKKVPAWLEHKNQGWITAEYGMLPRATHQRNDREAVSGKQGGRSQEIQRLIGRSLRRAVELGEISGLTIKVDCDVICADGGTRTAAISGGWVALWHAIAWAKKNKLIEPNVSLRQIAAISVGLVNKQALVDLCYEEDSLAEFDLNLVFNDQRQLIEIQGTGEQGEVDFAVLSQLVELGLGAGVSIFKLQSQAINYPDR